MRDTGAATAAVHLSYFLMNQLYPGIRDKDHKRRSIAPINIAGEVLSGKDFVCQGAGHL